MRCEVARPFNSHDSWGWRAADSVVSSGCVSRDGSFVICAADESSGAVQVELQAG